MLFCLERASAYMIWINETFAAFFRIKIRRERRLGTMQHKAIVLGSLWKARTMKSILTSSLIGGAMLTSSKLAAAQGYAQGFGGYDNHPMMWGNWFMGPMMMVFMLVVVVIAIVLILKLLGFTGGTNAKSDAQSNARAILDERFAKGEIDKPEYEERKKTLFG